jgi:hypothetical protein
MARTSLACRHSIAGVDARFAGLSRTINEARAEAETIRTTFRVCGKPEAGVRAGHGAIASDGLDSYWKKTRAVTTTSTWPRTTRGTKSESCKLIRPDQRSCCGLAFPVISVGVVVVASLNQDALMPAHRSGQPSRNRTRAGRLSFVSSAIPHRSPTPRGVPGGASFLPPKRSRRSQKPTPCDSRDKESDAPESGYRYGVPNWELP